MVSGTLPWQPILSHSSQVNGNLLSPAVLEVLKVITSEADSEQCLTRVVFIQGVDLLKELGGGPVGRGTASRY